MRAERRKDSALRAVAASVGDEGAASKPEKSANKSSAIERDQTCPICFGTGMKILPEGGARRCDCQTKDYRKRIFEAARIPPRYEHCTLANFEAGESESNWRAKTEAQILLDEYAVIDGRGLLFIGPVGVGKTHLAVAILRELISRYQNVRGLFYQFGALLRQIQDSYNPVSQASELGVLQPVFDADVLVLDELGASKPTDWVRDTMMQIINARYNDKRLTIFTTNYPDVRKDDKSENLEDRIGAALRSRLYEMCKAVPIDGDDYRKRLTGDRS